MALGEGSHRFGELRRRVEGVSEKMLSQTLRALERDGMVTRTVVSALPPRVEYELTGLGARSRHRSCGALADVLEGDSDTRDVGAVRRRGGSSSSAAHLRGPAWGAR